MTIKKPKNLPKAQQVAERFTHSLGTITSLVIHSIFFVGIFGLRFFGVDVDSIMLILTTVVSLEAIYLSLFIQMTVNRNTQSLEEVEEDVAEIAQDVDEIEKDVDEIQADIDEVQKDIDEVQKDVDEIQEDVEEITEEDETQEQAAVRVSKETMDKIEHSLAKLMQEIEALKQQK